MKNRSLLVSAGLIGLAWCASATGASDQSGKLSRGDASFLERAAKAGLTEVAISQGALDQLTDPEAKSFAETIISEPAPVNTEVMTLAAKKQVTLPAQDKEIQDLADKWSKKMNDVDLEYVDKMVSDHVDTIRLFERGAKSRDPEIAAFAAKTLPTLEHHLDMIQAIKRTFRKD